METLKYKIINSKSQYREYCKILEGFVESNSKNTCLPYSLKNGMRITTLSMKLIPLDCYFLLWKIMI